MTATEEKFFNNYDVMLNVFGELDKNIAKLRDAFDVDIFVVDRALKISGDVAKVRQAKAALDALEKMAESQIILPAMVKTAICIAKSDVPVSVDDLTSAIAFTSRGKAIRAKTLAQKQYAEAIKRNSLTFGVGPAGTGKTYLAVALAVSAFKNGEVSRIILTRPAVEAGEKLGFLPGDLSEKVDPYLRPLFDALRDFLGDESYLKYIEKGAIEIAPLAFMRGRTLKHSFIILDEAQNATVEQMKMFLTRIGEGSKAVVTGDLTQSDLPRNVVSGLDNAIEILSDIEDIKVVRLTSSDVVRGELVAKIVEAYEKSERKKARKGVSAGDENCDSANKNDSLDGE